MGRITCKYTLFFLLNLSSFNLLLSEPTRYHVIFFFTFCSHSYYTWSYQWILKNKGCIIFKKEIHEYLICLLFFCACRLFVCTLLCACVLKAQVKFTSHFWEPHLSSTCTICSHLLQHSFEVYLHCDWVQVHPFLPFVPFCILSDSVSLDLWLSLPFLLPYLSSFSIIHFSPIHPFTTIFFYCLPLSWTGT